MTDKSCVSKVKALGKTLDTSVKDLRKSFEAKRERFDENIVPKIVATCSKIAQLLQKEGETVMKDCKRPKHLAYVKRMVERSTAMFASLTEWIQSFSNFAPKTTRLIQEWFGSMRKAVSKVLAYVVKLGDFLDAHKYRIVIGFLSAWLAYRNRTTLHQIYDFPLDFLHGGKWMPALQAGTNLFLTFVCRKDYDTDIYIIIALTAAYSMHCNMLRMEEEAQKRVRDGFNQALQKNAAAKFFKDTIGDDNLDDELAFAYSEAFESATDVIYSRTSINIAQSTDMASTATAAAYNITMSTVRILQHFVLTLQQLMQRQYDIVNRLWASLNPKLVVVMFIFKFGCSFSMGESMLYEKLASFGWTWSPGPMFYRSMASTVTFMKNTVFPKDIPKPIREPIPDAIVHRSDVRLGPTLLTFFLKFARYYYGTQAGWYILKKLSLAFNDRTKRIVLKKDAIKAVVSGLSTPLSLEELLDSTEEAVAALTGNDKIRKKVKALKAS